MTMVKDIIFDKGCIGVNEPSFIIAEAGVNHNGSLALACELAEIAKGAGANAIKFQLYNIDEQISSSAPSAPYQKKRVGETSMKIMASSYEMPWETHVEIVNHCNAVGIKYIASCFDPKAVDFYIQRLNGDCLKIASGEITNHPLLRHIAGTGLPIILSTGMCDFSEVERAVSVLHQAGAKEIILLHCVSNYPACGIEINIRAMKSMADRFGLHVGYSDHTTGNTAAVAAIALGARVIEKHFTLDKSLIGPDHAMSLNPEELRNFIAEIRSAEEMLGNGIKVPTTKEMEMKVFARRGVVASRKILAGESLTLDNTRLKRPCIGVGADDQENIIGKIANQNIDEDMPILESYLK